ncbi:MAG: hypothetical protein JWL69_4152 [Phycisphaerales bacterium]|nr:hypothetical protein [Phycisphaerales bacterium]
MRLRYHPPMLRRLFTLLSALSLVLCVATLVLWVRSYRHMDGFSFWTSQGLQELRTRNGSLFLDNEPQRQLDCQPLEKIGRRYAALISTLRELNRQEHEAMAEWQKDPDRFKQGGAAGPVSRVVDARLKTEPAMAELSRMREVYTEWDRKAPVSPPAGRSVSLYSVLIATAALPMAWLALMLHTARVTARRKAANKCTSCGYDLRATPGRCPECGTVCTTGDPPAQREH